MTQLLDETLKKDIRMRMLQQRKSLPAMKIAEDSLKIQQCLLQSPLWEKARSIALYMAKKEEVQTHLLFEQAVLQGKKLYLPRCKAHAYGEMDFVHCTSEEDMAPGFYGIMEPTEFAMQRSGAVLTAQEGVWPLDILLVPGVAFDTKGFRIGFGGGYYDRFLCALQGQHTVCVGAAFSWQILPSLPHETWDMPIQALVSEEGLQWI